MNTEHTNQSSQAEPVNQQLLALVKSFGHTTGCAKNAFGELCTCGVDEAIAAAEQAQQAAPVARDVLAAFGKEVKRAGVKAWGAADESHEGNAIEECDITAIVDRYAAQPPAVAGAVPGAKRKIGTLPVKDRYFLCRCEKCGWIGSSEECRESINHMYGDGDYYCPSCGANGPDEMASAEATFNAMLAAASQASDPIKRLIAMHNELLGEYPYCYFELAYTRRTDWMAWLCTKPREDDPERKVLACGQGLTAEEACAEAISAAQKGGEA